jgi:hypothetical protein
MQNCGNLTLFCLVSHYFASLEFCFASFSLLFALFRIFFVKRKSDTLVTSKVADPDNFCPYLCKTFHMAGIIYTDLDTGLLFNEKFPNFFIFQRFVNSFYDFCNISTLFSETTDNVLPRV